MNAIVLTGTLVLAIILAVVVHDEVNLQYEAGGLPPLNHVPVVPAIELAPILARQLTGKLRTPVALEAIVLGLALASVPVRLGPLIAGLLAIAGVLLAGRLLKLR